MFRSLQDLGNFLKARFHMFLSEEDLSKLFTELVGSTEKIAKEIKSHAFDKPTTVVFSPARLYRLIRPYLVDPDLAKENPRTMKVIFEELVPAIYFDLALARIGYGRHEIIMSEAPDVALVKLEPKERGRFDAVPVEITHVGIYSEIDEKNPENSIAKQLIEGKFIKKYPPQTILLVGFRRNIKWLQIEPLAKLLCPKSPFHGIWAFVAEDEMCRTVRLIRICPPYQEVVITETDLPQDFW